MKKGMNTNTAGFNKNHRTTGRITALLGAALLATQMMAATPASAVYDPTNPNPVMEDGVFYIMEIGAPLVTAPQNILWNGEVIDLGELEAYVDEAGNVMIPIRVVTEAMGYEVNWIGETRTVELIRGAHWITLKVDADWYAFGKRAPQELGVAPIIHSGRTYVPATFFSDILPYEVTTNEEGSLEIREIEMETPAN